MLEITVDDTVTLDAEDFGRHDGQLGVLKVRASRQYSLCG